MSLDLALVGVRGDSPSSMAGQRGGESWQSLCSSLQDTYLLRYRATYFVLAPDLGCRGKSNKAWEPYLVCGEWEMHEDLLNHCIAMLWRFHGEFPIWMHGGTCSLECLFGMRSDTIPEELTCLTGWRLDQPVSPTWRCSRIPTTFKNYPLSCDSTRFQKLLSFLFYLCKEHGSSVGCFRVLDNPLDGHHGLQM